MIRLRILALVAAVGFASSVDAAEAQPHCGEMVLRDRHFCEARELASELKHTHYLDYTSYQGNRERVWRLSEAYVGRARRQQNLTDFGAGMVVTTATLSLATAGHAQRVFGYATAAPPLLSRLNANEPTRDLYHAGAQALSLITRRYDEWNALSQRLEPSGATQTQEGPPTGIQQCNFAVDLTPLNEEARLIASGELRRLVDACVDWLDRTASITIFVESAKPETHQFSHLYVSDVLKLDDAVLQQDQMLRHSPIEALGTMISVPLRTLDGLITGNNSQQAINYFKTAQAVSGLDQHLSAVDLAPLPEGMRLPPSFSDSDAAKLMAAHPQTYQTLATARSNLQAGLRRYNERLRLARQLETVAKATQLRFIADASSGVVTVTLSAPAASGT